MRKLTKSALCIALAMLCACGIVNKRTTQQKQLNHDGIAVLVTRAALSSRPCMDVLGAAKYPGVLDVIPKHYAIGVFANTFGDAFPIIKRELEAGRSYARVNLLWSDSHSYGDADKTAIKREAGRYQQLCKSFPGRVALAPFTEHNLRDPEKYLDFTQKHAPDCKIVNSVWRGNFTRNATYINEVHGDHAPPKVPGVSYYYSYDGENANDANVSADIQRHANAAMFCMWNPRNNGKWSMNDTTPRPARQGWPSRDILSAQIYLFSGKGQTSISKNWIIKPLSERHGAGDLKGDKLLIIAPIRSNQITLRRNGQKVGVLKYYGSYQGGGFRYYAQVMGWKLGAALDVFINGKQYGTINAGFRDGIFR